MRISLPHTHIHPENSETESFPVEASFPLVFGILFYSRPPNAGVHAYNRNTVPPRTKLSIYLKQQLCLIQQMPLLSPFRQLISGCQKSLTPSYQ